jgi:membrane peptidoglycan carboxypeptidase
MLRWRLRKWVLHSAFAGVLLMLLLGASTLWSLFSFWLTQDLYPNVTYAAPDYRPEVSWTKTPPPGWVPFAALPRAAWVSVLAAEDGGFFAHDGVEWQQSFDKIRSDIEKGEFPHGISTLNQQIAKNLYFGARAPILRKFQEIAVARRMDSVLGKKRVLEIYLNIAEWGPGVVGIGAAARYYFKRPASRLKASEFALLANLLPNPRVRGTWVRNGRTPPQLSRIVSRTLRRMPSTERKARAAQQAAMNFASNARATRRP